MCCDAIEKFRCGHEDRTPIPCEGLFETGTCGGREPDKTQPSDEPLCAKCKEDAAEEDFLQEQLQKFSVEDSLKPSTPPVARDPNAPKRYHKWCIEWQRCKHRSHPRPSDIERNEGDEEYLTASGIGQCYDCSTAEPSKITQMKQNGDYEKHDPWGALSRVEVGEGCSNHPDSRSLEEIAGHHSYSKEQPHAEDELSDAPPPSPDRDDGSDDDTGTAKGKGRAGEPVAARAVEAASDSDRADDSDNSDHADDSDEEVEPEPTKKKKHEKKDEEDEDKKAHRKAASPPDWSSGPSSHPLAKQSRAKAEDDSDGDSDDEEEEEEGPKASKGKGKERANAEELKEAGVDATCDLNKEQAQAMKDYFEKKKKEKGGQQSATTDAES
ncbi:MAG: hypothetical protein Q9168_000522 [Polycauliona sp. 1 TL-2023]